MDEWKVGDLYSYLEPFDSVVTAVHQRHYGKTVDIRMLDDNSTISQIGV